MSPLARRVRESKTGAYPPPITVLGTRTAAVAATSATLAQPSGVRAGDVGILVFRGNATLTPPSGWTSTVSGMLFKQYGASEGSVSISAASSTDIAAVLMVLRNVNFTTPLDASTTQAYTSGSSFTAAGVVSTVAKTFLVSILSEKMNPTTGAPTVSGGTSNVIIAQGTSPRCSVGIAAGPGPVSAGGTSSVYTWTMAMAPGTTTTVSNALFRPLT